MLLEPLATFAVLDSATWRIHKFAAEIATAVKCVLMVTHLGYVFEFGNCYWVYIIECVLGAVGL
jgi:hypothetical protein